MSKISKILEEKLQDGIPSTLNNISIGNFTLSENEPLYAHISSQIIEYLETELEQTKEEYKE